ncbi:MAG: hypothetical protein HC844_09220 [Tabrizicola sp.]|nr:hypothetical protein [Tabrizicola sp.]
MAHATQKIGRPAADHGLAAGYDPALWLLLAEIKALSELLPTHGRDLRQGVPANGAEDDRVEAMFDNMPV